MKVSTLAFTAATAANVALAQPAKHNHAHLHDMHKRTQTETSWVSGPTAYAFVLDGKSLSIDEVCNGVANNQLKWADNAPAGLCDKSSSSSSSATPTPSSSKSSAPSAAAFFEKSSAPSSAAASSTSSASGSAASQSSWGSWSGGNNSGGGGVTSEFPDGQLDCGTFPSQYGALPLNYLGMGGWSGLQSVTFGMSAITDIVTGVSGDSCSDGMMCSYACPPGYQKSQWPTTQGATGQSVGGIQCKNGKLYLTNPDLSKSLCIPGQGGVQATNKASGVVAICRTDYPGTESETVPVELQPGETEQITNPNSDTYYQWTGKSTSAQYYLNPIGTSAQDGCQWGTAGSNKGNWAPINFGVGYKNGKTWLSIFQNKPTTTSQYQGTVELQGDLSDKCIYQNGQYCGATGCNSDGCTVSHFSRAPLLMLMLSRYPSTREPRRSLSHHKKSPEFCFRNDLGFLRIVLSASIIFSFVLARTLCIGLALVASRNVGGYWNNLRLQNVTSWHGKIYWHLHFCVSHVCRASHQSGKDVLQYMACTNRCHNGVERTNEPGLSLYIDWTQSTRTENKKESCFVFHHRPSSQPRLVAVAARNTWSTSISSQYVLSSRVVCLQACLPAFYSIQHLIYFAWQPDTLLYDCNHTPLHASPFKQSPSIDCTARAVT